MSYNFDGKIVNQKPKRLKLNPDYMIEQALCEKCSTLVTTPAKVHVVSLRGDVVFEAFSYAGTKPYIYETKSGNAVVYCSEYCRNKHNHRFKK